MDLEHEGAEARAELLAEELTDAELQELLRRLGQAEFGGSERATIGAVVEATGHDAIEIGRILGDIRREAYNLRFGSQLRSYERRLERVEDRVARPTPTTDKHVPPRPLDDLDKGFEGLARNFKRSPYSLSRPTQEETEFMADLMNREESGWRWSLLILLAALAIVLTLLVTNFGRGGHV